MDLSERTEITLHCPQARFPMEIEISIAPGSEDT